jgi:hypothetical protein
LTDQAQSLRRYGAGEAWLLAMLVLTSVPLQGQSLKLPEGKNVEKVRAQCSLCHGLDLVAQQRLDRRGWSRVMDQMIAFGAPVPAAEREALLTYLETFLGQNVASPEGMR